MIKDIELAMVYASNYALNYLDNNNITDVEKIIKQFLKDFDSLEIKSELKIYAIAAINDIIKLKIKNKGKSNKQLTQMLIKNIPDISKNIKED